MKPAAKKLVTTDLTELPSDAQLAEAEISALVSFLVLVAMVDGRLDEGEEQAIAGYVSSAVAALAGRTGSAGRAQLEARFAGLAAVIRSEVEELRDGASRAAPHAGPDAADELVASRVRIKALELFGGMEPAPQKRALAVLEAVLAGDERHRPKEDALYRDLVRQLAAPRAKPTAAPKSAAPRQPIHIHGAVSPPLVIDNHPLLEMIEQRLSTHPVELASQLAHDYRLLDSAMTAWNRQREAGYGRLAHAASIDEIPADRLFLDRFVYALRPSPARTVDLIVLGDLHGCYSCLKAAILQTDFLGRVWAHQRDPEHYPDVKLVFLGDYIDRGRFSFDGVLRAALQLYVSMPEHVILLRGNHEAFLERDGFIYSSVYPADALNTLAPYAPIEMLDAYRTLFDAMPTSFLFDRTLFVHGGIPRDATMAARWQDLSSLNDPNLRFEMMWSDPCQARYVPAELQASNARFAFGVDQFRAFMERIGCTTLIRGHERFAEGFHVSMADGELRLLSLFSAGGVTNQDLPEGSAYRGTVPMAASVRFERGAQILMPWTLDWEACNAPRRNRFLQDVHEYPRVSG